MRTLLLLLLSFPAFAGETILDNEYVRVTRDAAPCAAAGLACAERIIVALGELKISSVGTKRALARGDVAVFAPGQSYEAPDAGGFLEVSIKPGHPAALPPVEVIAPEKNALVHDGSDFFIFEEKLAPGDTRARHSHSQRVVIQLNRARLEQWPDGGPSKLIETVPDLALFSPPVIHTVKNVGDIALRGIIIEFKPR